MQPDIKLEWFIYHKALVKPAFIAVQGFDKPRVMTRAKIISTF